MKITKNLLSEHIKNSILQNLRGAGGTKNWRQAYIPHVIKDLERCFSEPSPVSKIKSVFFNTENK